MRERERWKIAMKFDFTESLYFDYCNFYSVRTFGLWWEQQCDTCCMLYVSLIISYRDMEKKKITSAARMLCGFVSAVVPDSHKLDVLLQLAELTPDDQNFIWPYVKYVQLFTAYI